MTLLDGSGGSAVGSPIAGTQAPTGTFFWDDLVEGYYELDETVVPAGYTKGANLPREIHITNDSAASVIIANTPIAQTGSLVVTKRDSSTEAVLDGAAFELMGPYPATDLFTPDTSIPGVFSWSGLEPGTYTLTETSVPTGFTKQGTGIYRVIIGVNDNPLNVTMNVFNDPEIILGSITVFKHIDGTRTPLEGAQFMLEVYNNDTQQYEFVSRGNTAADGTFKWSSLPAGRYRLTETVAPAGYILDTTPIPVSLPEGEDVTENVANTPIPLGSITVFKYIDGTRTPLEGAQFMLEVFNNDSQQYEFVSRGNTAADGTFKWNSLPAGRYRLHRDRGPRWLYT